jgi:hypothetical protein
MVKLKVKIGSQNNSPLGLRRRQADSSSSETQPQVNAAVTSSERWTHRLDDVIHLSSTSDDVITPPRAQPWRRHQPMTSPTTTTWFKVVNHGPYRPQPTLGYILYRFLSCYQNIWNIPHSTAVCGVVKSALRTVFSDSHYLSFLHNDFQSSMIRRCPHVIPKVIEHTAYFCRCGRKALAIIPTCGPIVTCNYYNYKKHS